MVAYLIGTMHHRIGRSQEALDWFLKAIQGDPDKGDVFRMAREQIFEAKESIRFFEYLSEVEILRPLEIEEIAMLSTQLQHRTVRPGKTICQEGEPGQSMFIAMAGTTRISIGDREVVRIAPGEVFGEMSLLTGHPRVATVVAEDTVELLEIDRVVFKTILQANPPVATEIARIVSERQHQNDRLMGEMLPEGTPESAQERQSGESLLNRVKSYFELP